MTDAARTVINYLISTGDVYQDRPAADFRHIVAAQVIVLQQTISGVRPDHADATTAISEIRAATVFTDDERNSVIDAVAARMGQQTAIAAPSERCTSAVGQTCKYFFNFCTAVFWGGVMNLLLSFSEGMELTVTMAFQIGLRHPREGTLAIMLSTLICARNEEHKHDAIFYYDKINYFRTLFIQRRARAPPPAHALLKYFPDTAQRLIAVCPNLYQDGAPAVACRVSETTIIDHAHRNPTRSSHLSLRHTHFSQRSSRSRGDPNIPTLDMPNRGRSQPAMEDLSHALRAFSAFVQGNMRAGSDANAGGGVRMLGQPQRASTLPALGYGVDSQNSTGRDTDCESQPLSIGGIPALADGDGTTPRPQPSGAPHPLAIDAGRTSSEDVSRRECGLALALADAPPPAHTATAATLHAVHAAAPSAATAAALEEATAEVDDMIKRQQSVITKRRLQGKQADRASTIVAGDGPSTPLLKRARTSPAHTGEKDHPPPACPGTDPHKSIEYNGFSICNSKSKNKWRVVP